MHENNSGISAWVTLPAAHPGRSAYGTPGPPAGVEQAVAQLHNIMIIVHHKPADKSRNRTPLMGLFSPRPLQSIVPQMSFSKSDVTVPRQRGNGLRRTVKTMDIFRSFKCFAATMRRDPCANRRALRISENKTIKRFMRATRRMAGEFAGNGRCKTLFFQPGHHVAFMGPPEPSSTRETKRT